MREFSWPIFGSRHQTSQHILFLLIIAINATTVSCVVRQFSAGRKLRFDGQGEEHNVRLQNIAL